MKLFYKVKAKDLLAIRNEIFVKNGIPQLEKNRFEKTPFPEKLFGKNNLGDYTYELCRLNSSSHLEAITAHISRGDSWIKIYLNVFKLKPTLRTLNPLKDMDGMQFSLPPNTLTRMRLREDDFEGMPLFNTVKYKVKSFYTESGFQERLDELSKLIEKDLSNIDSFIKRWHELHQPMVTDWEGRRITGLL